MKHRDHSPWTKAELRALHARCMAGEFPSALAKIRGQKSAWLLDRFRHYGWPLPARKNPVMPKRLPAGTVEAMHADYQTGMSFAAVERAHGRGPHTVRSLFVSRGLAIREPHPEAIRHHRTDGTWQAFPPATESEIEAIIQAATKLAIPAPLRIEWRHWSIERRGEFIRRLRARLPDPLARPDLPFSANVTPFDYWTAAAWDIVRAANGDLPSHLWKMKLNVISQGVIWDGRLWFWTRWETYYSEGVRWTPERSRQCLHRAIWESVHGPLPEHAVVRFIDGNPNNLNPSNLTLSNRDNLCRENQAAALLAKSRERTAILLKRHHTPSHEHTQTLQKLGSRPH
jgi:hypothetical protein